MRTHTNTTQRAAVVMSGAIAALVIGGATAPAAYAQQGERSPANHSKSADHSNAGHVAKAGRAKKANQSQGSRASANSRRAPSSTAGSGHNDDWQAQSDPDGLENGGIDQPGGNGGYDPKGWDGNNGSGNDPDCEDDNRGKGVPGHCKDRPAQRAQAGNAKPARNSTSLRSNAFTAAWSPTALREEKAFAFTLAAGSTAGTETGTEVLGVEQLAGRAPAALAAPADITTVETAEGTLPNTGADAAMLLMLIGGLAALGSGAVVLRRIRAGQH